VRILFIVDSLPYPILGGASLRNYNLLRRIASVNEVWLAAFAMNAEQTESVSHFQEFCAGVEVEMPGPQSALSNIPGLVSYFLRGTPPELRFLDSNPLKRKISKLVSKIKFDVIHIDQVHMGLYLKTIPDNQHPRTIWGLHDYDFNKFRQIIELEPKKARKFRLWLNNQLIYYWEPRHAEKFGNIITVSTLDKQLLLSKNPKLKIEVIPNGVDTHALLPIAEDNESQVLLFVGNMAYLPCSDGVIHFYEHIFPLIKKVIPSVELWVVGKDPPDQIRELKNKGVLVTGRVDDVKPYYEKSKVCIVPLRAGSGTRLKILEAMALGRPVVSTSIGCEGLDITNGKELMVADTPELFAKKTIELLTDLTLRKQITDQAREFVVKNHEWNMVAQKLIDVYEQVASINQ